MEKNLLISANGPWYELFYSLSLAVTLAILLYEGYKRDYPLLKWILLLVMTRLSFIAGTKLVTLSPEEWTFLLTQFRLPEAPGKSLLGGLLFGGATLLGGYHLLKFKQNITDAFALALPIGIAIQRTGCFLTGCCFGKTSVFPWAVKYPVNTLPHFHQFNDGLLSTNESFSLAVHPVQLYEMLFLITSAFILFYLRKRLKKTGNLFLLSITLILVVRFITEFFRDVHAHTIGGKVFGVFNATQLVLLPLIPVLFLCFLKREKSGASGESAHPSNDIGMASTLLILISVAIFFRAIRDWFLFPEIVAILIILISAVFIAIIRLFSRFRLSPSRWFCLAGFTLPLLFMAQTLPFNKEDSVYIKRYKSLKVGYASGNFENSHNIGHGSGCDRVSQTEYFTQDYTLGAAGLEITELNSKKKQQLNYGINAMSGHHLETRISDYREKEKTLFGVNPYIKLDKNWIGIGGGLHLGNLTYITENRQKEGSGRPESGSLNSFIFPQLYLRFGPRRWFFADYHLADHFPSALPGFGQQIGIGTGLGTNNGTNVRFGFNTNDITYASGYLPVKNRVVLEPMILWGKLYRWDVEYPKTNYQFSMGVSYRFGFR